MRNQTATRYVLLIGGTACLAGWAARPRAGAAPAAAPPPAPSSFVSYEAGAAKWLNVPRTIEMSQGVTFSQDGAFLKTQTAIVNLDENQRALNARSQAPVHLYDAQNDLNGKQGFLDFSRHLASLKDDIVLVVKPDGAAQNASAGSLRSQFKDAATLTCQAMLYDYRRKIGRIPGPLKVRQMVEGRERVLTADSGKYDVNAQVITLTGNVRGYNGRDKIFAATATIGTKEGAEFINIPVKTIGVFGVAPADETPENRADSAPPPAAPPASATVPAAPPAQSP